MKLSTRLFRVPATWILFAYVNVCGQAADLPDPDGKPADMTKPVQVFILMGQSNMLGFGAVSGGDNSLEHAVKNQGLYPYLIDDAGSWTVRNDVRNVRVMCSGSGPWKSHLNQWMSIAGNKNIGPEHGIGHYVGEVLDAPVLILKSCIGNRSLGYDLLPPSAPGYEGDPQASPRKPKANAQGWYAGVQYDGDVNAALEVLKDLGTYYPGASSYEVAGFFFWQGAKDGGNGDHAAAYEKNLVHFIKDLRKDFNAPDALFVVATMGHGKKGSGGNAGMITDAQLAVDGKSGKHPEFKGNVATFYSNPVCMGGSANGHYNKHAQTYMNVGEGMGKLMAELLESRGGTSSSASSSAEGGASSDGPPVPALPAARSLAAGSQQKLDDVLLSTLQELSKSNMLKPKPIPLSLSSAPISLVSVLSDGTLTFTASNGQKADVSWTKLSGTDRAKLAILVAMLLPDNQNAQAVAGVYLEGLGSMEQAAKYYESAGKSAVGKFDSFFD
jgi:hypothetical protein